MTGVVAPELALPEAEWLRVEVDRLLAGALAARAGSGGFWWQDGDGRPDTSRPRPLWITARMTHCLALGVLLGRGQDAAGVDHGLAALAGAYVDPVHGGWFSALAADGTPIPGPRWAYEHAFVLLAGASAQLAGRPGAAQVLARACSLFERRFWDEQAGAVVEEWNRDWTVLEDYRGANANMHTVEAFLAVADATGEPVWRQRATRIATRLVDQQARGHRWRVPEHFGADWTALPLYHADVPDHPFRPYGFTPGHALEWARLLLSLQAALARVGASAPAWLRPAAVALFDRAVADGWDEARPGIPYTTDGDGVPVVTQRFHWVICEAIAAAWTLFRVTGELRYATWSARFWRYARQTFLDGRPGWRHEADERSRPSERTWSGRPDIYHALQATLIMSLDPSGSFAGGLRRVRD